MMIGKTIEGRPVLPIVWWGLLIAAGFLEGLAPYFNNYHFALASLMPTMLALACWLDRERPFRALVTESGLEVENPQRVVPFAQLHGLQVRGRPANPFKAGKKNYPILILYGSESIWIPARLDVSSDELYLFLLQQFPTEKALPVDPEMEAFRARKEAAHGADHVWCYTTRSHLSGSPFRSFGRAIPPVLVIVGICWLLAGIQIESFEWGFSGGMFTFFGGLAWLAVAISSHRDAQGLRNWRRSSLVICPDGLALLQGDLNGQLKWRELLDVKLLGSSFAPHRIQLKVAGVEIYILDLFNRPLALIYQHICYYWRGEGARNEND